MQLLAEDDCCGWRCHIGRRAQFKIKHIIRDLWICRRTASDAIGNKTNALQHDIFGETADEKVPERIFFPPKDFFFLLTSKFPPPTRHMTSFLLEPFFPFVLFLVHLLNCNQVLEHTFEDTKTPFFYSSGLKNNFLCHLFGLLFFRGGGSSLAWMGRPLFCSGVPLQLINVFKKKPFFLP